jgi:hypothetical protein
MMAGKLFSVLTSLALGACSVIGVREGTEEPAYAVLGHEGAVEIRQYADRIAAETTVAGDEISARGEGFRRLAGYIFGANTTRTSIAMTAPVAQAAEKIEMTAPVGQDRTAGGDWIIRFFMPARFTLETLPRPSNDSVRLVSVPGETMAVLRFSGSTGPEAVAAQQRALVDTLAGGRWIATGQPVAWFYDPPWTIPALRRNEVAAPVQPAR